MKSWLWKMGLVFAAIAGFVIVGIALETGLGIPFDTTYRIGCAGACPIFMASVGSDPRAERWPKIALSLAVLVNIGLFLTPLLDRPASRGEVMLFALPDSIIFLAARIASFQAVDVHQRAVRQQLILALIVAIAFCALLFAGTVLEQRFAR